MKMLRFSRVESLRNDGEPHELSSSGVRIGCYDIDRLAYTTRDGLFFIEETYLWRVFPDGRVGFVTDYRTDVRLC